MSNTALHTDKAPAAIGPYSQGIQAGNTIYVSGQIPIDPATGEFAGQDIQDPDAPEPDQYFQHSGRCRRKHG